MPKVELKTKANKLSVRGFIATIEPKDKQEEALLILDLMEKTAQEKPVMWGTSIIGFGLEHLKYESGRELDWFKIGFSPRKAAISLYQLKIPSTIHLFTKLGKFKEGKGCVYVKTLRDIDLSLLKEIIQKAYFER
jgi:hypothetical protein